MTVGAINTLGTGSAALAVLRRNVRVWRKYWFSSLLANLTEPLLYLLGLGFGIGGLVAQVNGMSYMEFIAPGLVISSAMYGATFEGTYGTFTRLVPQHTFEGILSTPIDVREVVGGEVLFCTIKALTAGCAVLLVMACFGLVQSPWVALVPVLIGLCGLLFAALSVLVSALSPTYDFFTYYFTLAITPMFLFSGIFFPLQQLPPWAQVVAWFSPLTHAVSACRNLFHGRISAQTWLDFVWLLIVAIALCGPAVWAMRRRLIK